MTTPLVTLQKPKDVSLDEIEAELNEIWSQYKEGAATSSIGQADTFCMIVYEPEEFQQLLATLGFYDGPIDGIHGPRTQVAVQTAQRTYDLRVTGHMDSDTLGRLREEVAAKPANVPTVPNPDDRGFSISDAIGDQNPRRIITLCPILGEDTGVTAQVSAYCPVQKSMSGHLLCCEYITLRGTKQALERVGDLVLSLMLPELPKFVWWKATPNPEQQLFATLSSKCNCIVVDSSYFSNVEAELAKICELKDSGPFVADLNWHRISPWQELTAADFDPLEHRDELMSIDHISIDYEKGNPAQALMFLGWVASRLNWEPTEYKLTGGIYDLRNITFKATDGRTINAELAAIPTADWGEIQGDLVGLRLSSDQFCSILCSETTGCMRMEAGGSAQACRTEQVTSLSDLRAEELMSKQLQRWGRDNLYEESLDVTAKILKLR